MPLTQAQRVGPWRQTRSRRRADRLRWGLGRKTRLLLPLFPLLAAPASARADNDDIIGEWRSPAGVHVQVKHCGDNMCGRIVRMPDTSVYDINNPEPRLRSRPVLGIQVFFGAKPVGTNGWKGHMYVPENGRSYVARLVSPDKKSMQVSICGPMGLLCSREVWARTR